MRPAVLKACWDVAVVGDDAPVPVADRDEYRAMLTDPDPSSAARTFGLMSASLVGRVGPLLRVLADAAHEPELADLLAETRAERLTGTRLLLAKLSGADPDTAQFTHAVDVVYAYVSPRTHPGAGRAERMELTAYGEWLGEQVGAQISRLSTTSP